MPGEEWNITSIAKLLYRLAKDSEVKLEQATDLRGYTVGIYESTARTEKLLGTVSWQRAVPNFLLFRPVGRAPFYVDLSMPNYVGSLEVQLKLLKENYMGR